MKGNGKHRWKFFRYGGIDQVSLETGTDLLALEELDPKLWAAMACPVDNIEFDRRTLEYLDLDNDKRIKITEITAAVKWTASMLKNPDDLCRPGSQLPLAAINTENEEARLLYSVARQILKNLGKHDSQTISLEDLADTGRIFSATAFNGDGIIPAESACDEDSKRLINDIMACCGSEMDRSGFAGVSTALLQQFENEAKAFMAWHEESLVDQSILFAGAGTFCHSSSSKCSSGKNRRLLHPL
jgi:hypothetical protein